MTEPFKDISKYIVANTKQRQDLEFRISKVGNEYIYQSGKVIHADIIEWLEEQEIPYEYIDLNLLRFKTEEDAMAFKLRWL